MFNKKNPMRYFSGSTFARLPLYKLAAGGTAVRSPRPSPAPRPS